MNRATRGPNVGGSRPSMSCWGVSQRGGVTADGETDVGFFGLLVRLLGGPERLVELGEAVSSVTEGHLQLQPGTR